MECRCPMHFQYVCEFANVVKYSNITCAKLKQAIA